MYKPLVFYQNKELGVFGFTTGFGDHLRYTVVNTSKQPLNKGVSITFPSPFGARTEWVSEFSTDDSSIYSGFADLNLPIQLNCTGTLAELAFGLLVTPRVQCEGVVPLGEYAVKFLYPREIVLRVCCTLPVICIIVVSLSSLARFETNTTSE